MKEEKKKEKLQEEVLNEDAVINEDAAQNEETTPQSVEESAPSAEEQLAQAQARIKELEDKNLRMMAEFDNFRRRTNKEKLDLMATAGERIFKEMLPLVDDFERAIDNVQRDNVQAPKEDERYQAMVEGLNLIYQKFLSFLDKNDVHVIETEGADFNTDEHEAVTTFAAGEDKKGKVIDCTQKGYKLGEKVIRFAKVVVGE
jgi:molecular chaperone GrpE